MRESVLLDILPRNEYNISGCSLVCLTKFIEKRRKWAKGVCSMSGFSAKANELLVEIYRNVQILEQNELKKQRLNISINEMHMIELIAKGKIGMTVSEIAQQLKVTKPSVTVAVNKLVQKGYCEKQRLPGDGRAVQVMLTPEGKKVEAFHRRCHRRIIAEICEDLSEEEREELLRTMTRINSYFQTKL
jgi:DNA-binding MarR family transcriptional regulator